jgi:tol-pal system protein YbgF
MKVLFLDLKPSTMSVALFFLFFSGCAMQGSKSDAWLEDKDLVLQSLQDVHVRNAQLQEDVDALDYRIITLERASSKQETRIFVLESRAVAAKKAKNKQQVKDKKNKPKTEKKIVALNKRLDVISAKLDVPIPAVKISQAQLDEKNAYTAAYLALKSGRYDEASSGFVAVIKGHPKGEYTDQSYYWLGESLAALKRYKEALESFTIVVNEYPKSSKYISALMRIAYVDQVLQQPDDAISALKRVIKEFPNSKEAVRAEAQLDIIQPSDGANK